ncbi:B3/4 domain-containing protein [candidate division KSB1 bacterium]
MISVHNSIFEKTPGYKIGCLELGDVEAGPSTEEFWDKFNSRIDAIRNEFKLEQIGEDKVITGMRRLYKSWKIDYTRYRPSSERLLRRVLKGNELYIVNTVVDVCNYISLIYKLPIGLYDKRKIVGGVEICFGNEGDSYMGITGLELSAGGKVTVYDDQGPVGSPATDSRRTAIDNNTTDFIGLFHCPENINEEYLDRMMDDYYTELCAFQEKDPEIVERFILKK